MENEGQDLRGQADEACFPISLDNGRDGIASMDMWTVDGYAHASLTDTATHLSAEVVQWEIVYHRGISASPPR